MAQLNVDKYRKELVQAINEKEEGMVLCAIYSVRTGGKPCTGTKCSTCRNHSVAWLFREADPTLLKNGDGLNPRRSYSGS